MPKGNPAKAKAAEKLEQLKKQIEFLQDLSGLCQSLNKQGKIHFSVFILYSGKYKVELFNTQVPAAEPAESMDADQTPAPKPETDSQPPKKPPKKPTKKPKSAGT